MNSKGHFLISLAKSIIRIAGGAFAIKNSDIRLLAMALIIAEILGIAEEMVDNR